MKTLLALFALAFTAATSVALPEDILINGNFATGTLAPWTPTGGGSATVMAGVCFLGGPVAIEQTVTTKVGARYYLGAGTAGNGACNLRATATMGGTLDADFDFNADSNGLRPVSTLFTATTTSTRISLSVIDGGDLVLADGFVLYELVVPSRFVGSYGGTVSVDLRAEEAARTKSMTTASAQVDEDGKIVLLEGTARVHGGILFDDASSLFFFGGRQSVAGDVAARGKNLTLTFEGTASPAQDEGSNSFETTLRHTFKLKRKSR